MTPNRRCGLKSPDHYISPTSTPDSSPTVAEKRTIWALSLRTTLGDGRIYLSRVSVLYPALYTTSPPTIVMATGMSLISDGDTS